MEQTLILDNLRATQQLGLRLAAQLSAPVCILLEGDLGAGKTSLARAIIHSLTDDDAAEVPSPTFTLLQTYDAACGQVYHYDLYRLKQADEVYELDWETALAEAITLVEWPERLDGLTPQSAKTIRLEIANVGRRATLQGFEHVEL